MGSSRRTRWPLATSAAAPRRRSRLPWSPWNGTAAAASAPGSSPLALMALLAARPLASFATPAAKPFAVCVRPATTTVWVGHGGTGQTASCYSVSAVEQPAALSTSSGGCCCAAGRRGKPSNEDAKNAKAPCDVSDFADTDVAFALLCRISCNGYGMAVHEPLRLSSPGSASDHAKQTCTTTLLDMHGRGSGSDLDLADSFADSVGLPVGSTAVVGRLLDRHLCLANHERHGPSGVSSGRERYYIGPSQTPTTVSASSFAATCTDGRRQAGGRQAG